jgi:transposase
MKKIKHNHKVALMRKSKDWSEIDLDLGVLSDYQVAAKYDLDRHVVSRRRRSLGIPPAPSIHLKEIVWDAVIDKLGKVPDAAIAEELGISSTAVGKKRNSLGIPKCNVKRPSKHLVDRRAKGIDWSAAEDLFGKVSDKQIAEQFNVNISTVRWQRARRGVGPASTRKRVPWYLIEPELGKCFDRALAEKYGVSYCSIILRRQALGIPPFYPNVNRNKDRKIDFDFSKPCGKTHREIAAELGVSVGYVGERFRKHGVSTPGLRIDWEPIIPHLGTAFDKDVANMFGISTAEVCKKRNELNILAYGKQSDRLHNPRNKIDWAPIIPYLGTMIDKDVADKFGVSTTQIWRMRQEFNIPPYKKQLN